MTPPPIPKLPRSTRIPVAIWIILGLFFLVTGGVVTTLAWFRLSNDAAVRKLEASARARGEPVTLSELATNYPAIPDSENAAVLLMDLWGKNDPEYWKAFRSGAQPPKREANRTVEAPIPLPGDGAKNLSRTSAIPREAILAAESFLGSNRVRMAAVQQALRERPKARFPVAITNGLGALLPHAVELRTESRSIRVATALAVENQKLLDAVSTIEDHARLSGVLKDCPLLIEHLVRIAIHTGIIADLERLVTRLPVGPAEISRLEAVVNSLEMSSAFRDAMIEERAMFLGVYEMSDSALKQVVAPENTGDESAPDAATLRMGLNAINLPGIVSADRRFMLETMERVIELSRTNSAASLLAVEEVFAKMTDKIHRFPPKLLSGLLMPAMDKAAKKFASMEARRRCALTALAVERYRLEHGNELPGELSALVPKYLPGVPEDPFDGKPIRFRRLGKGFVVYSVGADREDHQGRERRDKRSSAGYDETFVLER